MSEGYIKLHRKMREWEWYDNSNTKAVFLHFLFTANWCERRWHGIVIKPGQLVTSRKKLAEELNLTDREVRTALKNLQNTGEITLHTTNKWTLVTVEKWAKYQLCDDEGDQQTTSNRPTNDQQTTTTKERKNIRIQEDNSSKAPEDLYPSNFMTAWNSICIDLPKVKTMTDARRKKIHARLEDFSEADIIEAMLKIQESDFLSGREGGWKANFDWLFLNSTNMAKVLEGNYVNKPPRKTKTENDFEAARRRIQEQYERVTQFGERTASG